MASNTASCSGVSQVASSVRSVDATRARRCDRNWRTLLPHQEAVDGIGYRVEDPSAQRRSAEGNEEHEDQDEQAVLRQDRAKLPGGLARDQGQQDRAAV